MNSWKFNSTAQHLLRRAIIKYFKLESESVYRAVKSINGDLVMMYDGKVYEVTLKEIENGTSFRTL
jgi:hypothetical protein